MDIHRFTILAAVIAFACAFRAGPAPAADAPEPKPPGGSIMKMDKFYPGTMIKVGASDQDGPPVSSCVLVRR